MQKCLPFTHEVMDHFLTLTAALDDDLLHTLIVLLRLGNGQWNLAFFLLRRSFRDGSHFLVRSDRFRRSGGGRRIHQRGVLFTSRLTPRRTSGTDQGCHYEQGQRSLFHHAHLSHESRYIKVTGLTADLHR